MAIRTTPATREKRVQALVGPLAEPRDERARGSARHGEGVGAEEKDETEDQKGHGRSERLWVAGRRQRAPGMTAVHSHSIVPGGFDVMS